MPNNPWQAPEHRESSCPLGSVVADEPVFRSTLLGADGRVIYVELIDIPTEDSEQQQSLESPKVFIDTENYSFMPEGVLPLHFGRKVFWDDILHTYHDFTKDFERPCKESEMLLDARKPRVIKVWYRNGWLRSQDIYFLGRKDWVPEEDEDSYEGDRKLVGSDVSCYLMDLENPDLVNGFDPDPEEEDVEDGAFARLASVL